MGKGKAGAWIRWILGSEAVILFLALAGPGYRHSVIQEGNRDLFASFFIEDPTFLQQVGVNLVVIHLFMGVVLTAAHISARRKGK